MAKAEKLSPKHPDWVWLKSPEEMLMQERSTPFDSKVRTLDQRQRYHTLNNSYTDVNTSSGTKANMTPTLMTPMTTPTTGNYDTVQDSTNFDYFFF